MTGDVVVEQEEVSGVADHREIHFLWRPFLRDPADEMVLEVAVEANAEVIVTHNVRDFKGVREAFGVRVETPAMFLAGIEVGDQ